MKTMLAGAALLVMGTCAVAAAPQDEPADRGATQEKKICRTERMTGSLTRSRRICLTAQEWRDLHARTKRGLDDFVGGASGGCRSPDNPLAGAMCGG